MSEPTPPLLALDFDGVLCDGLLEYFQTAWRAYRQLWADAAATPPEGLAEQFYRLRPVVETGWEMPVVIRAVLAGVAESEIFAHWSAIAPSFAQETQLSPADIGKMVDQIRDAWIADDLDSWLALHRFYPGVIKRLQASPLNDTVIITTKEERFVMQLLQQQGIALPEAQIFGKSCRQPKTQTLRHLIQTWSQPTLGAIWFVEDRLKTLQSVKAQPDLGDVRLFLGDWGYNTASERESARLDSRIHLLPLSTFTKDFSSWIESSTAESSLD